MLPEQCRFKTKCQKTKVMHITGPGSQGPQQIRINGTDLENVTDFKYLGSIKASDGTCTKDVKCRIGMANRRWYILITSGKTREYLGNSKLEF
jgi:hypothetical protein